jgi:RND superfamily putative drug exporter
MKDLIGIEKWVAGPRTKWVTLLVWVVAAGLLSALLPSINKEVVNNEPPLSDSKSSEQAGALAAREFSNANDIPALIVWHRKGGLSDADLKSIQALSEKLNDKSCPLSDVRTATISIIIADVENEALEGRQRTCLATVLQQTNGRRSVD